MADDDKKPSRAELTEAVRELRDEVALLRAGQAAHSCHGHGYGHGYGHAHCNWGHCGCWTWHAYSYPLPGAAPYPTWTWTVTSGNLNATSFGDAGGTVLHGISAPAATNFAAGVPQVVTFSSGY